MRGAVFQDDSTATARVSRRRWIDTTRTREACGSHGPTRPLLSAPGVVYRPSLFDGRGLNVEWHSCRRFYRHSHFLIPRFLARTPLGHFLPIHVCAISRYAA